MTMPTIDDLVADLRPVRRLSPYSGLGLTFAMLLLVTALVLGILGPRDDVASMRPAVIVLLRGGLCLLLGVAASVAVVAAARPGVGARRDGWQWALAAAALIPAASLWLTMAGDGVRESVSLYGPACLVISLVSALLIGSALVVWLRRGAVTDPVRAGWLVGLAAGALGTFAYSLHCPTTTVHFVALWYSLSIAVSSAIGRLAVPRLLHW